MAPANRREAATHLQADWAGIRLSFGRMGTRKTLSPSQKQQAADPFDAAGDYLSASSKLLDTKDPAFKAVTAVLTKAREAWLYATLPYTEPGVRLIRQDRVDALVVKFGEFQIELAAAVTGLASRYDYLKERAREKRGTLYNPADYPPTLDGLFSVEWDLPSLAPPEYLMAKPDLYAEQSARIAARFDQAVSLAEEAFAGELADMLDTLQRKLNGLDDGTEKRLHESSLTNLREFFTRFRTLNLHSSAELDRVVAQAEEALSGRSLIGGQPVTREELRDSESLRRDVRTRLSAVTATLEGMMVSQPRRALTRRPKPAEAPQE
jgi:hypothetical protein